MSDSNSTNTTRVQGGGGSISKKEWGANKKITIFLMVAGSLSMLIAAFVLMDKQKKEKDDVKSKSLYTTWVTLFSLAGVGILTSAITFMYWGGNPLQIFVLDSITRWPFYMKNQASFFTRN